MRLESDSSSRVDSKVSVDELADIKLCEIESIVIIPIDKLLTLDEIICFECNRMSSIPQGAFAVYQVRKNYKYQQQPLFAGNYRDEKDKENKSGGGGYGAKVLQEGREPTPLKYNSKLMNSIWGLYNRYSVHNFKKIDANEAGLLATWGEAGSAKGGPAGGGIIGTASAGH